MKEERIHTLHPEGKEGVSILKRRYDLVAMCILDLLREAEGTLAFSALIEQGKARLGDTLDGSPSWYLTTVKLDLEARGMIRRRAGSGPQVLELHDKLTRR